MQKKMLKIIMIMTNILLSILTFYSFINLFLTKLLSLAKSNNKVKKSIKRELYIIASCLID